MLQTIFYVRHKQLGATMTEFAGVEMPLFYSGITEEHIHTRTKVGLFDLCHMGRIGIRGREVRTFLDRVTPSYVSATPAGRVLYSFLLDPSGGVRDDITIYVADDFAMLVVNAANKRADFEWICSHAITQPDVDIEDWSDHLAMLAIQGPDSDQAMAWVFEGLFEPCAYYTFRHHTPDEVAQRGPSWLATAIPSDVSPRVPVLLYSATGYTGERGYELYCSPTLALAIWDRLMESRDAVGICPVGLGARDSLRLEAGMPLYGHELTLETTPLEAGLAKYIAFDKPGDFIGRRALEEQRRSGVPRRLVGLEMVGRTPVPRHGYAIRRDGCAIGQVTSGIFSPTLGKNIALAYVQPEFAEIGAQLSVEIRGRDWPAQVVKRPFYKRSL